MEQKRMKGELAKTKSGTWVIWYWKEDENSFEGGKIPVHPDIQEKMNQLDFMDHLSEGKEVDFVLVTDERICKEFSTNEYAKIVPPSEEEISEFKKIRASIIRQLQNVVYDNGDMADIGNEVGMAIARHFDENQSIDDFIAGVRHGASLIDGTH